MAARRSLIVNADDFGRSEGINRGVLRAHREGIVTSASLMVRHRAAEQAACIARAHPALGVGLHVDLGEWAYRDGAWVRVEGVVRLDDRAALAEEAERQLARFRTLMGATPTHLDSHQNLHRDDPLRAVLRALAERLGVPLRHESPGIRHCGAFFGRTSRGMPYPEGIRASALVEILDALPEGFVELRCHPGESVEPDLAYGVERAGELRALCDPRVREALARNGIRLRSFHGILGDLATSRPAGRAVGAEAGPDPSPGGLVRTGYALRREGRLSAALDAFARAAALAPAHEGARRGRRVVAGEIGVLRDGWAPDDRTREPLSPVHGRVLHVVGGSLPDVQTGYAIRTGYVTRAQRAAGLDPHVVTQIGFPSGRDGDGPFEEPVGGVPHHRLRAAGGVPVDLPGRLTANLALLADVVRRTRPAVLHAASDYRNALLALAAGRRFGLPVVYEMRGFWEETRLVKQGEGAAERESYRWHRAREIRCAREVDRVVTLSEGMKAYLTEQGVEPGAIHVVPNAVDPAAFPERPRDDALGGRLGIEPGEVVVGYVSTLTAYEGIHVLLEALARLLERGHRLRGLVVGDGEERGALEALAGRLGIADRVVFAGRVSHAEVPAYYGLIDVFVVPRTADRVCRLVTPLKPFEAMAAARPVVASDLPPLREIVEDGATGLLVPAGDPEALAAVLQSLAADAARRVELGRAARAWVCRHRTWQRSGEQYLELYRSLDGVLPDSVEASRQVMTSTCEPGPP